MIQNRCYQKFIVITFAALLTVSFGYNSYANMWMKTFGGNGSEQGYSVQQTIDGGFIIAGYTDSFGAGREDVYLIKTDGSGNLDWQNTFGGNSSDYGYSVQQTADGGYIIMSSDVYGTYFLYFDTYLIKTDGSGNLAWEKILGRDDYIGNSVQQITDGGYIIAGGKRDYVGGNFDVSLIYYKKAWETVYSTLFDSPSDLNVIRQYRDEFLSNTTRGVIYKTLLYNYSKQALEVLLSDPYLILQAKDLIETNRDAVLDVLDGYEGIIYNTEEIAAFLYAFAKKSPPILKIFAYIVRWDMLRKQKQDDLFFGFRLK